MYLRVLDDNTLSFEGTEGQVFSMSPTMSSGDIFSVNDISGIQSMVVNADGTITIDAQTKSTTIKNSASNTSTLILENTNADAVDGPILEFFRDTTSPADNDHMGSLVFTGRDDAGNKQEYGRITMHNDDASAASGGGELVFKLTEANSDEQEYMRLRASSRQIELNTQADDIDLTYNTDSTNDFFFINAGTERIGIGDAGTAPSHLVHIEATGANGELVVERTSGAGILLQAQTGTGVVGTNTNHPLALKSNGTTRISVASGGAVTFNSAYTFPTSDGSANQVLQTNGSGTLSFATVSGGGAVDSIANFSNNRVLTASDADSINGEANLNFDGTGLGIGTSTIPHGSKGAAKLAIEGTNQNVAGPHIQTTTASDNYPLLQILSWQHDNISINFDAWYTPTDGWTSSDAGSNFQIYKHSDALKFRYDSGVAADADITWNEGFHLTKSGELDVLCGFRPRKAVISTISSNTVLGAANSGGTFYWTGGSLTLPADATVGMQVVIINNTGSSATPGLGNNNAIASGWTSHAAMADETARTYICPVADKWIYIG